MAFGYPADKVFSLYVYGEQCIQNAKVLTQDDAERLGLITTDDGEVRVSDDINVWDEGTEAGLVEYARKVIGRERGPTHLWRCARNVLEYFGAPVSEEAEEE